MCGYRGGHRRQPKPGIFEEGFIDVFQKDICGIISGRKHNWEKLWRVPLVLFIHLILYTITFPCRAVVVTYYWSWVGTREVKRYVKQASNNELPMYQRRPAMQYAPQRRLSWTPETNLQQQSLLCQRLPPEIRLMIWAHALGAQNDEDISIMQTLGGELYRSRPRVIAEMFPPGKASTNSIAFERVSNLFRVKKLADKQRETAILRTCRLFYNEAAATLYRTTLFHFRQSSDFSSMPLLIPAPRLQDLRRLQFSLYWVVCHCQRDRRLAALDFRYTQQQHDKWPWSDQCRLLGLLSALQEVTIRIAYSCKDCPMQVAQHCQGKLDMLEKVRASTFTVVIETACSIELMEWMSDAPFKLQLLDPR